MSFLNYSYEAFSELVFAIQLNLVCNKVYLELSLCNAIFPRIIQMMPAKPRWQGATSIFGPPLMRGIFAFFTQKPEELYLPGAAYVLAGILTFVEIFLVYRTSSFHKIAEQEIKSWKVPGDEVEEV